MVLGTLAMAAQTHSHYLSTTVERAAGVFLTSQYNASFST